MHLPHSTPRFQLRLGIVLFRTMGCHLTAVQFARMIDFINMSLGILARPQALMSPAPQEEGRSTQGNSHERRFDAAGDEDDVGDATLVRPPELTGEADAVSAADAVPVADVEVNSVAASNAFISAWIHTKSMIDPRQHSQVVTLPPAIFRDRRRNYLSKPVGARRAEAAIRRRLPAVTAPRHHVSDNRADGLLGT
ncbi:hypothetical protein Landi51_07357 [Colletotrichum acutatum]